MFADFDIQFLTENGDLPLIKPDTTFLFLDVSIPLMGCSRTIPATVVLPAPLPIHFGALLYTCAVLYMRGR